MDLDYGLLSLIATVTLPVLAFLARKRIATWLGRLLFTESVKFVQAEYLEVVEADDGHGHKTRLWRPNARGAAMLGAAVPGLIGWATSNIKIKLPAFTLPEGVDLKEVGMNVLAQKALSGKKLKLEDAIPLGIGYAKDYLEKSGILESIGKIVPGVKASEKSEAATTVSKEVKALTELGAK
jgi:hypothetical protein